MEKYNKIFAAVNGDEELRKKTLKLIKQERKNLARHAIRSSRRIPGLGIP